MRSSLETKRLRVGIENTEVALVQRVGATVCPFGVERYRCREAIPHTALSTKPDLAATCCGLAAKCTPFGFAEAETPSLTPEPKAELPLLLMAGKVVEG